jgi:hypothetical protein
MVRTTETEDNAPVAPETVQKLLIAARFRKVMGGSQSARSRDVARKPTVDMRAKHFLELVHWSLDQNEK